MKKIQLILAFLSITILGFNQNVPIDFETGGNGANWTWAVFENDDNPALEIIDNPDKTGANTSDKVAKFTARSAGEPWAGCESQHGSDLGTFSFNSENSTVKIMVWKSVISDVGIKFATADNWALVEKKVANTKINEWEELTFDFSSHITEAAGRVYDQIIIFPDFRSRSVDEVVYFDNITIGASTPMNTPMSPAPTPTLAAADVISIFSDAYTNVPVNTFRTDWSAANFQEISINGNKTLKYSNLDFVGIETTGANTIDATNMEFVHFNVWTPNATLYRFKIVDFGADGEFGGGDDSEHEVVFENPNQEEWITVTIPFSDMTNLQNRANLAQYIFSSQPVGGAILYVDNILFGKGEVSVNKINPLTGNVYPNPTANTLNIDFTSSVKINGYSLISMDGKEVISNEVNQSAINTSLDISGLSNGVYMLQIATENGSFSYRVIKQ